MPVSAEAQNGASAGAVQAEQIRTLYRQGVGVVIVNALNAAIVAAVLWPSRSPGVLVVWVAAMAAVTACRLMLRSRYLRVLPPEEQTPVWARRFVMGAVAAGMLWGVGGALFYDPRVLVSQLLVIFVIGGMVAGASGTLAFHIPAFLGFVASAVLPTAARLFLEGDKLHVGMGMLALIYGAAMTLVAANTHRAVAESFRLRFENQDLLEKLSGAQISLAEANRTLEERVAERGLALERQTEALRDAQRMESVGLLAGGVAHDFNNLLTVVLGNAEFLLEDPQLAVQHRNALEQIRRSAKRGAILVSQLLTFSRRQVMVRRILNLNDVVSEVQPLLGQLIGEHIDLVVDMQAQPLPVRADFTQLQQVIINLATNARDAMASGGKLTIGTELVDGIVAGATIPPGRYVVLFVQDTGVGMDAETKRMIFHPFFTTKEVGRGTGLGLATVYGIVEQSAGYVFVETEPGRGSCFRVVLPWAAAELSDSPGLPPAAAPILRTATILLAEDEPLVRELTVRTLRSVEGLTVIEAENGEQALKYARRYQGRIDLLVSDVVMPKLGGLELANILAGERPDLRILLLSGYSRETIPPADDPARVTSFLAKPFTPGELLDKVSQLLAVPITPRPKPPPRAASQRAGRPNHGS